VHYKFIALPHQIGDKVPVYLCLAIITVSNPRRVFSLQQFTRDLRIRDYRWKKTTMSTSENPQPTTGGVQPCLTLVPATKSDVEATELIQFSLKVRAGSAASAPTYKRKVARFNGGSPSEWIEVL